MQGILQHFYFFAIAHLLATTHRPLRARLQKRLKIVTGSPFVWERWKQSSAQVSPAQFKEQFYSGLPHRQCVQSCKILHSAL